MSEYGTISSGAGVFDNFKSSSEVNGTKEFLESNGLVAKVAFLLLVLVVFVIAVRFSAQLLSWLFSYNNQPYLIDGMINAKNMLVIPQDPNNRSSIPIIRSDNESNGIRILLKFSAQGISESFKKTTYFTKFIWVITKYF